MREGRRPTPTLIVKLLLKGTALGSESPSVAEDWASSISSVYFLNT